MLYTILSLTFARPEDSMEPSHNSTMLSSIVVGQDNIRQSALVQNQKPVYTISIIIPVYNEELNILSILNHIKNILSETLLDYELIVINDGSTDKTEPVLLEEQKLDKRVKILSYPRNKGKGHGIFRDK